METMMNTCPKANHSISILNFEDGDVLCYAVVVINGKVKTNSTCCSANQVVVQRINGPCWTPDLTYHILSPTLKFKCIVQLEQGINTFAVKYCSAQQHLILHFVPRCTPFCVVPVYIICKGHDGRFQAPDGEDNSINSACDRIDTGLRLLQSFIAEMLQKGGYGRRTFQLQVDRDPSAPNCHVFYSTISVEEAFSVPAETLWSHLGRELMNSHLGKETHKFVAFLSCTFYEKMPGKNKNLTYENILANTKGHVALGGGGLALFGSACLYTWACSVEEVVPRLSSSTDVDTSMFMDNSNYRGTHGGCFATTLGAVCHELGHTFDLGHTSHGIMGKEYHNIDHMFLPEVEETMKEITPPSDPLKDITTSAEIPGQQDLRVNWKAAKSKTGLQTQNLAYDSLACTKKEKHLTSTFVGDLKVDWKGPVHRVPTCIAAVLPLQSADLQSDLTTGIKDPQLHTKTAASKQTAFTKSKERSFSGNQCERLCSTDEKMCITAKNDVLAISELNAPDCNEPVFDLEDKSSFWAESCLAILAYNKWINLNSSAEKNGHITFDRGRKLVSSTFDIKVVDLRDTNSKSVLHWKFRKNSGLTKFTIPGNFINPNIYSIVIVDSVGNLLKESFHEQ